MITHRMGTQQPEQPVRFYKVIALSFLFLTILLLGVVIFITSKKAFITVFAKQDNKTITFDAVIGSSAAADFFGQVTSTRFSWTEKFQPTGTGQVAGIAKGTVTIFNTSGAVQPLVKTTRLLSTGGILFRLTSNVVVPAGGQISTSVYADQKGEQGDLGPSDFTIPGLTAQKQKVIFAKSTVAMSGGLATTGVLSGDDISNAKTEFVTKMKEEFLKTLPAAGGNVGRVVSAESVNGTVNQKAGDVVSEFSISGTSTMTMAEYNLDDLKKRVEKEVNGKFDSVSEKILSLSPSPSVDLNSVDPKTGFATVNIREEVAVTLNENSGKLSVDHFFGKSKDEIERYLLGLDHVSVVDVKFSPSWTMTAPSVADKIDLVVRSVK